jgi:hypothetical protein
MAGRGVCTADTAPRELDRVDVQGYKALISTLTSDFDFSPSARYNHSLPEIWN